MFQNNISLRERSRFMKKLSFLLESGISFLQALHFIKEREDRQKLKKHVLQIIDRIHGGMPIHKSFDNPPYFIDRHSLALIESGNATGTLSKNCSQLSQELEIRLSDRNRLIGSLIYPCCIASFAVILTLVLVVFVFPKILPLITLGNAELPLPTRILIIISTQLKEKGIMVLVGCVLMGVTLFNIYKKSKTLQKKYVQFLLSIPFISKIIGLIKARFITRLISLYLQSGHTLWESLDHISRLEKNIAYKEGIRDIMNRIRKGEKFSKSLIHHPKLFPKDIIQFAALGEESGNLWKTLQHVSLLFDEEMKEIEKTMFALLEPALMLFLGVIVGFVALSLISPIYSITSSLSQPSL